MLYVIYRDYFLSNFLFKNNPDPRIQFINIPLLRLNIFQRALFFLERKLGINIFPSMRFDSGIVKKLKTITNSDQILFFDFALYIDILYIQKIIKTKSIKLWLWNTLKDDSRMYITEVKDRGVDIYTFDDNDAYKYNIKFLNQVYKRVPFVITKDYAYDFFFIGFDKERFQYLNDMGARLLQSGYCIKFLLYPDSDKEYNLRNCCVEFLTSIYSYEESLNLLRKSKVIVDIVQKKQSGITQRILEGVFLHRKVLTNNQNVRYMDIYHPNNIFILDFRAWEEFDAFMTAEYVELETEIVEKYNFDSWIKNFIND